MHRNLVTSVDPVSHAASVPLTPDEIAKVAASRGLIIPAECAQGVAANLALLARNAERLLEVSGECRP